MNEIILTHLRKMEFVCGLKQFKEYKKEEASELLGCLSKLFGSYGWMTEARVDYILHAGMRGQYGDFYHVCAPPKPNCAGGTSFKQQRKGANQRGNCLLD
jgi:hypothetical protein